MKSLIRFSAVLALLSVASCVEESQFNQEQDGEVRTINVVGPESIVFEPVTGMSQTKATIVEDGSALKFNWVIGDTLGIFPNKGNQVEFPISAADGSTSASFDGGGWSLRNNASYAAYYPFSVWNYHRDNETILLDYSGQVQDGNGSYAHLSAYDFLASVQTTPLNGSVTFNMERQGSILYIDIVVPEPETITSLVVSCDEAIFVEKASLDISGSSPVVTPVETVETLTLSFTNTVTTTANETVRAYMAVQPLDFSDKVVTATLVTESGSYTAPVTSRVVNKGKAAFLRFSDAFTPVNIEFADAEVKRLCVENWDADGDGELSYKEAAAVTDLGTVFRKNKTITTFNELEYFTGLTEIIDCAFEQSSLTSVIIPQNVTVIGSFSFSFSKLITVKLPESLLSIRQNAFQCTNLKNVYIPSNVTYIGISAFNCCDSLEYFSGKYTSSDGNSLVVDGNLIAIAPSGISEYVIPSDVKTICHGSIENRDGNIKRITIPEGVESMENSSIASCPGLTSIAIPNTLTRISSANFIFCDNLEQFIGKFASENGRCLIVNQILMAIATSGLTEFVVPENVTIIGSDAFYCADTITSVILPENITEIGFNAFDRCGIRHITLPSSLKIIGYNSFISCKSLSELIIPSGVETIDSNAFEGCTGLNKITVNIQTPFAIGDGVFDNTNNCPIYVPNESLEAYKTTPGWSDYADRLFGIDVEGSVVGPGVENPD